MKTQINLIARLYALIFATLISISGACFAGLDIVPRNPDGENIDLVLKDTNTGKVLGNFWNRDAGTSDYGFESSKAPVFHWNGDRSIVAIDYGSPRNTGVCLYRAAGGTLKEIAMPQLSAKQAAPLDAINDIHATGTEVVRWQADGTLLVEHSAFGRVKSEAEEQPEAHVWATVKIAGDKAAITATTTKVPAEEVPAPAAAEGFDVSRLAGEHQVVGKNPDGTAYRGTVTIAVKDGVASLSWKIGETVSRGKGVLVGNCLGVALDDGIALYSIVGQADGQSLVGVWAGAGADSVNKETILVGNPDITDAELPAEKSSGTFLSLREAGDGQIEASVIIKGNGSAKKVTWTKGGKATPCQGIAQGSGLAILTPEGLAVYEQQRDNSGAAYFNGTLLTRDGKRHTQTLSPAGK